MFGRKGRDRGLIRRGLIYVDRGDARFDGAAPGQVVRNPDRKPPWLVVEREPHPPLIARWGGRLWRCEIIDELSPGEEDRLRHTRTPEGRTKYARAIAIKLISEQPLASLFGRNGARVCAVIDGAHTLTEAQAQNLAAARAPDAKAIRDAIFVRWLNGRDLPDIATADASGSVLSVLADDEESPVDQGLSIIDGEVLRRATAAIGDAALVPDPDDDEGADLVEPWAAASAALCDAALAFGAQHPISIEERDILATAWRAVFGADPA